MTEERIRFRRKKQVLTLAHIFFVLIAVFGISAMYLNSNYGKGISGFLRKHMRIHPVYQPAEQ